MTASPSSRTDRLASKAVVLHTRGRSHRHRRRGSSYVFFMGTAMVVMIIGLSALMAVRIQRWGAATFDISTLTADGQTLVRRSIEWAANKEQP